LGSQSAALAVQQELSADSYYLSHQNLKVAPTAAVICDCYMQVLLPPDTDNRGYGDARFLKLDLDLFVEVVQRRVVEARPSETETDNVQ